ncbi:glycerophosphoryl diester phosphodiesterase membrane domain-containing protein [Staphylococcus aureus]
MLKVAGQSQLTINNWMEIVSHPASVILLIIFILSVAFLIYVEFSLLVYMVYAGFIDILLHLNPFLKMPL